MLGLDFLQTQRGTGQHINMKSSRPKKRSKPRVKATIPCIVPREFLSYLTSLGLEISEIYPRNVLDRIITGNPEEGLPEAVLHRMFPAAVKASGRADTILNGMMYAGERMFGLMIMNVLNRSSGLYEALGHLIRYSSLTGVMGPFHAAIEDDQHFEAWWDLNDPDVKDPRIVEYRIAMMAQGARIACGQPQMPIDVVLPYPDPGYRESYERAFGGTVEFSGQVCHMTAPSRTVGSGVLAIARREDTDGAEPKISADPPTLHTMLTAYILENMATGKINLDHVSKAFRISARTLQRWMEQSGIHYQELVDQIRMNRAKELLVNENFSLSRIAFLLGYTAQTNFQNAFRRWMGISPGEFRARQIGADPAPRKTRKRKAQAE